MSLDLCRRVRRAVGEWLCRRGWHKFVRRWTVAPPSLATSTWHKVCTRSGCGQEWKLVREMCLPADRRAYIVEKDLRFAERYGSTPEQIAKAAKLSPQDVEHLLQQFQKKFPLAAETLARAFGRGRKRAD